MSPEVGGFLSLLIGGIELSAIATPSLIFRSPPNTKFLLSLLSETEGLFVADAIEVFKSEKRLFDLSPSITDAKLRSEFIAAVAIESVKSSNFFLVLLFSMIPAKFWSELRFALSMISSKSLVFRFSVGSFLLSSFFSSFFFSFSLSFFFLDTDAVLVLFFSEENSEQPVTTPTLKVVTVVVSNTFFKIFE
ncbi:Uncharacterised protein [Streptococcus pneumoniae]|nr:Uncharacterised protein [Streptococcus pneumoniae]CKG82761.1 Uncharacterised protein [Streptococcus pneumoniae]